MIKRARSLNVSAGVPIQWEPDLTSYGVLLDDVQISNPSYTASGGFQEIFAAASESRVITDIGLTANSWGGAGHAMFQFAFGDVGAEVVVGEVFHYPYKPPTTPPVPFLVPAGNRLSVRVLVLQNVSSLGGYIRVGYVEARQFKRTRHIAQGWTTYRNIDAYSSLGFNAPAGTPGAWTELLHESVWTANRHIIGFAYTNDSVADIGIGPAIDSVTSLARIAIGSTGYRLHKPIFVPAGSRIWHRSVIGNSTLTCYAVYASDAPVPQMWL